MCVSVCVHGVSQCVYISKRTICTSCFFFSLSTMSGVLWIELRLLDLAASAIPYLVSHFVVSFLLNVYVFIKY